jgi:hypothetical protein
VPVKAAAIPVAQWEQQARATGLNDYAVETLVQMFLHYEQYDFWGNSNVLGWLLGHTPTTFAQFLERFAGGQ